MHVGGDTVSYSITSGDSVGYMTIDSESGQIRTAKTLDHETDPFLLLGVQVQSGSPPSYLTTQVRRLNVSLHSINL